MSTEDLDENSPDEPGTLDIRPYVTSPANGTHVYDHTVTVYGGGEAKRNVRIVSPGTEDYLSDEKQMGTAGTFELQFNYLKPGRNFFEILQWKMFPASHKRSELRSVFCFVGPVINPIHAGQIISTSSFFLEVTNCSPSARVRCFSEFYLGDDSVIGEGIADAHGIAWVLINTPRFNTYIRIYAVWSDWGKESLRSATVVMNNLYPHIVPPQNGAGIRDREPLTGRGMEESTIGLYSYPGGVIHYGTGTVINGLWKITPDKNLRPGQVIVNARIGSQEAWSDPLSITITPPVIDAPDAGSLVDRTFSVSGINGPTGGIVEIVEDLSTSGPVLGSGLVHAESKRWTVELVNIYPKHISLVARRFDPVTNERSDPGPPRNFKVRPGRVTNFAVSVLPDGRIRFEGKGETGVTVEVIQVSGPEAAEIPTVLVAGGVWETIATDWPFGTYAVKIIQKVPDGDRGWIESYPSSPFGFPKDLQDVTEVTFTKEYRPTFSGKGYNGATVEICEGTSKAAPDARVSGSHWSSEAFEVWGPSKNRKVQIRQFFGEHQSPTAVVLDVTIPPLAPHVNNPPEETLAPTFSGTCWPGAEVKLKFSDEVDVVHEGDVVAGIWTFQRKTPFAEDTEHTVTVTQFVAEQLSPQQSKKFTVTATLLKPEITGARPDLANGMGRNMIIEGEQGVNGASMQIYDAQYGDKLGLPETLSTEDGRWRLTLTGLDLRIYYIKAQQSFGERDSDVSDWYDFEVKLLPPCITVPKPHEKRVRTSMIEGRGIPTGRVSVWLQDDDKPLLDNIVVDEKGSWETLVTLPVGTKTIYARQTFVHEGQTYTSEESSPLSYCVVPAAPYIETPVEDGDIGQRVVVAGYGIPGDSVTVTDDSLTPLGTSVVREDRTWWVSVTLDQPGGIYTLNAVAALEGFESAGARRSVRLGAYLPSIDVPAVGRRVSVPVQFAGQGLAGIGQVQSWFDPEQLWAQAIPVDEQGWETVVTQPMREGGHWCRFRQTLSDGEPGAISGVFTSQRFEVEPGTPKKS